MDWTESRIYAPDPSDDEEDLDKLTDFIFRRNKLHFGPSTSARDFIDVRDGVRAMRLLLDKGNPGESVNICNNTAYKIQEILDMLVDISGTHAEVISDPKLFRVADEPLLLGDNSKIAALGYERQYTMRQTLEDVFEDWMGRC